MKNTTDENSIEKWKQHAILRPTTLYSGQEEKTQTRVEEKKKKKTEKL